MNDLVDLISALAKFAWPTLVAVVVWRLFPAIRRTIESRSYSIKLPGGTEISVQQATNEELELIADVAKRVADLEGAQRRLEEGAAAAMVTPTGDARVLDGGEVTIRLTPSGVETGPLRHATRVLWIGRPVSESEIGLLVQQGVRVEQVASFDDARRRLSGAERFDVIVARVYLEEGGLGGSRDRDTFTDRVRWLTEKAPLFIYEKDLQGIGNWIKWIEGELDANGPASSLLDVETMLRHRYGLTLFQEPELVEVLRGSQSDA